MRPPSIVMFERLFLASLAIGLISFAVGYQNMLAALANEPTLQRAGFGSGFLIGTAAFSYAIYLLLWYLIARKAAKWAKWVLIVLIAISLISLPGALTGTLSLTVLLGLAVYALQLAALVNLFRPDAKAWFRGEMSADPATFD